MSREEQGLFWWQQSSAYWEIPFYAEMGVTPEPEDFTKDDWLAAREQLWAMREADDEIEPLYVKMENREET